MGEEYVNFYCRNENRELKKIVDPILKFKFGWIPQQEYDEFYSIASMVVWDCEKKFDPVKVKSKNFKSFVSTCIYNKIKSQLSYLNRAKRTLKDEDGKPIHNTSLDATVGEEEFTLKELIPSDFKIEDELEECYLEESIKDYLELLSPTQRNIAELIMKGYTDNQIREQLKLSEKKYREHMNYIKCNKNTNVLTKDTVIKDSDKESSINMSNNQDKKFKKSKTTKLPVSSIIRKMNDGSLRYNHPLQRSDEQHSLTTKSNIISDILQDNPIPSLIFAEQIINGFPIIWNLDGKQRSTGVKEFVEDKFKISKNVRRSVIDYQVIIRDEDGMVIPDENGFPQGEWRQFDIANKKFSQLPHELQNKFLDYCFDVTTYLDCSSDDIAYHIQRYNDGKMMNSTQKGLVKLSEEYALMIRKIASKSLFKEGGFNFKQYKNGTIDRVCIESVMATEFLDEWKKTPESISKFLKENATKEHFDNLKDTVERLEEVITEDVAEMFDKKDSFIYFSVFARFKETGFEDGKFVEFMTEYAQSLHKKFEEIETLSVNGKKRSTKDKSVVVEKIEAMEQMMNDFLKIEETDTEDIDVLEFIKENVSEDIEESDVDVYNDFLDMTTSSIDKSSRFLAHHNRPSLLALVAYAYKSDQDVELTKWLRRYLENNNTFLTNQKKNYLLMLEKFKMSTKSELLCG